MLKCKKARAGVGLGAVANITHPAANWNIVFSLAVRKMKKILQFLRLTERHGLMRTAGAWTVLIIALAVTLWGWHVNKTAVLQAANLRFDNRVQQITTEIQGRMRNYEQVLRGGVGLFAALDRVNREDWWAYVTSLQITSNYPGIVGIGFAKRVPSAKKIEHIRAVHAEGFPEYAITPAGARDEYYPIVYLEPFEGVNLRAFGYDMFSEPVRRSAMAAARDTGLPALSGKVTLVQDAQAGQASFLMYLPVYHYGRSHDTVAARRAALLGFVYSPFRMNDLMQGVLESSDIDLEIYDGATVMPAALMYDMDQSVVAGITHNRPRTIVRTLPVEIAGHRWTVQFKSLPEFEATLYSREPAIILISGLLISAMLFAITMALANTRARAMALAERMTRDLQKSYDQLQQAHAEMESFSYSVSHDLRAPLRSIDGFSYALLEEEGNQLDATGKDYLRRIRAASQRMSALIDAMLGLARLSRSELRRQDVNLSAKAREIAERLQQMQPERRVEVIIEEDVLAHADAQLIRSALENLLGNAWKFTGKTSAARIEFGTLKRDDETVYFVKDNGVGFDMAYAGKLFGPFQRLHTSEEFDGTGIGLATVHRIISRHGGRVWAESAVGEGAIFYFTLT